MKRIWILVPLMVLVLQWSCTSCKKKEEDVYFYLTQEQKNFIQSAPVGDTVIWESDGGLRDTGIVEPVVYDTYIIEDSRNSPKKIGQKATYQYRIVGTNKLNSNRFIGVFAEINDNTLKNTVRCWGHPATAIKASGLFGGDSYQTIYWGEYGLDATDTLFWSREGFLGYYESGIRVEKIR